MTKIQNPILRGFNPDPSIIRVGEDYYIATSTFEWFPGVQIHHSRDLVHWELITQPLRRVSQLDMRGNPDSCGVWAPCLSYHEGTFYLVYSNVRSFDGVWKDTPNYLVTTEDIRGEWSDPIFLSSSGFDGSLFHDDNGRKWFASMLCDHRKGLFFGGTFMQEYSETEQKLIGPSYNIFKGSSLGITEAPHIYKRDGFYYLITAEGGTEYGHAVSLARSTSITGPYELHPQNPFISTRNHAWAPLQKCGHADLVNTPDGRWYAVFLVGRPLTERGRCTLGRETAIEELYWRADGWPELKHETRVPRLEVDAPVSVEPKEMPSVLRYDFDTDALSIHFQSLRVPMEESWISRKAKPGVLRLYGRESLSSFHRQSLIAHRVQHFHCTVETSLDFHPDNFQQMAGLVCYYNTAHWHYLHLYGDDNGTARYLQVLTCDKFQVTEQLTDPLAIGTSSKVRLKVEFHRAEIQFFYALEGEEWQKAGGTLDGSILSDDYVRDHHGRYRPAFTGSFIGLCCQDLSGQNHPADFEYFEYRIIKD